ncbi:MAG: orotidine 5'-phosphate decarboxylase [Candidatus Verstraetearchaeota archaeon]|nr:orotidine 5'-phosphate decarboxylase [Candidatus Verstraetearchaeota archaeon]
MSPTIPRDKSIVIACDVPDIGSLEKLVESTHSVDGVGAYKIGFSLGLRHGLPSIVSAIRRHTQKPVIYDHQKGGTDVPHTAELFAELMASSGIDYAILFPFSSPSTEEEWIRALQREGVVPVVGALMTTKDFLSEFGGFFTRSVVSRIFRIACGLGVDHYVLPGNKPEEAMELRMMIETHIHEPVFFLPGVGAQGGEVARLRAVMGRRWHCIVGRSVYASTDPAASASRLASELDA